MKKCIQLALLIFFSGFYVQAENGTIKGLVIDQKNGEPLIFANVFVPGTAYGVTSDVNGFFSFPIPAGTYTVIASSIGYDSAISTVSVKAGSTSNLQLYLKEKVIELAGVEITAQATEKKTQVKVSTTTLTAKTIDKLPSVGGESDIAQYLQVLPGVVFTGDQGGQLYIRGGAMVNTLFMIDGMPVYNPIHSIGLFSTYETDIIKNVDVMTGGFNAEYGNRISAVVDVTTRDGNKKEFDGSISASPFMAKAVFEGPLKKMKNGKNSAITFVLSNKTSYLNKTSPALYSYADSSGLPYSFNDTYGKLSFHTNTGSKLSFYGFNFMDRAKYLNTSDLAWNAAGGGFNFVIIPGNSKLYMTTKANYSQYNISLSEADGLPRYSAIKGFNVGMDFTYFLKDGDFKYGFDVTGFRTEFEFYNKLGEKAEQNQNTTELALFAKFHKTINEKLVLEPSLRFQYYGSLGQFSPEPRFALKYNLSNKLRLKFATGIYTQNLISTKSDRDIVNLFSGFLSGPEENLTNTQGEVSRSKLQRAIHLITGLEWDIVKHGEINIEPYYMHQLQLINLNRNKLFPDDPNFMIETGQAYGIDFLFKYDKNRWFLWAAYSLGWVKRFDGEQTYPTHFDRRNNINLVASYELGKTRSWELSARWNFGSGFPFTRTVGFYEDLSLDGGIQTPLNNENGNLGILYEEKLNQGRLPVYHRLDISGKKKFAIGEKNSLELNASITNTYNRKNMFYFDRVRYTRVDQLPILPSLGLKFSF